MRTSVFRRPWVLASAVFALSCSSGGASMKGTGGTTGRGGAGPASGGSGAEGGAGGVGAGTGGAGMAGHPAGTGGFAGQAAAGAPGMAGGGGTASGGAPATTWQSCDCSCSCALWDGSISGEACNPNAGPNGTCDCTTACDDACVSAGFGRATIGTGTCATTNVPLVWSCSLASYGGGDGCTCGCGAHDPDCAGASSAACAASGCATAGSCAKSCADIAATDNTRCADTPAGWTCSPLYYKDGSKCDCGCGAPDPDCLDTTPQSCDYCNDPGSCTTSCDNIDALDNSKCDIPGWTCDPSAYGDGAICDCGCGIVDPDCPDQTSTSCQRCAETGSCATTDCSQIDPQLNSICS